MVRAWICLPVLFAFSSCFPQASIYPGEARGIALEHLASRGVLLPEVVATRSIAAPVSGYLIDAVGYVRGVLTAFRIGVKDEGEMENAGEVFVHISYGSDGSWFPPLDGSPELLLEYEFMLGQDREFMALVEAGHPRNLDQVPPGTVYTRDGTLSGIGLLAALDQVDVVFVGEQHDHPLAHQWELYIWRGLGSPDRALALEMFETDVQPLLDLYLQGELSRDAFLAGSRPWGNYREDYEPLVEYALEKGYQVIAANVPRPLAASVARGGYGALEGEQFFTTLSVDSSNAGYRTRFLETMSAMGGAMHGTAMDPLNLYRAQLLKDAVMAGSIAGRSCVFICGRFHSDHRSGIPDQLAPGTSYSTVAILRDGEIVDLDVADFVIAP